MKNNKPKLVNSYNKPLTALANVMNRNVGSTMGFKYLRDEWFAELGNRDERFAEWLDYAFSLTAFNDAAVRTFFDHGKYSYAQIKIIQEVIPRGEK